MPITSQIAIFLNMLFKVTPLFPSVGIAYQIILMPIAMPRKPLRPDIMAEGPLSCVIGQARLPRATRKISALRLREAADFLLCNG